METCHTAGNRCTCALVNLSFSECFLGNVELLSIYRNLWWNVKYISPHYMICKSVFRNLNWHQNAVFAKPEIRTPPRPRSPNVQGGDAIFFITLSTYSVLRKLLFYTKLYFGVNSKFLIPRPIPYPGKGAASWCFQQKLHLVTPAAHALCTGSPQQPMLSLCI